MDNTTNHITYSRYSGTSPEHRTIQVSHSFTHEYQVEDTVSMSKFSGNTFTLNPDVVSLVFTETPAPSNLTYSATFRVPGSNSGDETRENTACFINGTMYLGSDSTILKVNPSDSSSNPVVELPGKILTMADNNRDTLFVSFQGETDCLAVYNPESPEPIKFLPGDGTKYIKMAVSPDGKTLLAATDKRSLEAFDTATGERRWKKELSDNPGGSPTTGPDGKTTYVSCWNGDLYALDVETGSELWKTDLGSVISDTPAVNAKGNLFVLTWNGRIHALEGSTGEKRWSASMESGGGRTPAVGRDGTVYTADEKGTVYAFNPEDGSTKWQKKIPVQFASNKIGISTLPDDSLLLSGTSDLDGKMVLLDGSTGRKLQQYNTAGFQALPPVIDPAGMVAVSGTNGATMVFTFETITPAETLSYTFSSDSPGTESTNIVRYDNYAEIDGVYLHYRQSNFRPGTRKKEPEKNMEQQVKPGDDSTGIIR